MIRTNPRSPPLKPTTSVRKQPAARPPEPPRVGLNRFSDTFSAPLDLRARASLGISPVQQQTFSTTPPTYVTPREENVNLRASPPQGNVLQVVRPGEPLRLTGQTREVNGDTWQEVVAPDGESGWVRGDLVTASEGPRAEPPWVLPANGEHPERTGDSQSASAWAMSYVGAGTDYADNCLGFMSQAHGVIQLMARCREMSNPAEFVTSAELTAADPQSSGHTDSAFAAFLALRETGKMSDVPGNLSDLPEGAILFFGPSTKNDGEGHVCLLHRNEAGELYVVTSGWGTTPPNNQVQYIPLEEMVAATGAPLIGFTTPAQAFSAETFPPAESPSEG
jgi:SH3-like domain-containing protein